MSSASPVFGAMVSLATLSLLTLLNVLLSGCASPIAPATLSSGAAAESNTTATALSTNSFAVTPATTNLAPQATLQLQPSGGSAPYTFQMESGTGKVDTHGLFTAPATNETDLILVSDSALHDVYVVINVTDSPSSTTGSTADAVPAQAPSKLYATGRARWPSSGPSEGHLGGHLPFKLQFSFRLIEEVFRS